MSGAPRLRAFEAYGIELEYMIVDRDSLAVRPVADDLLHRVTGEWVGDAARGAFGWSNELVLHLLEVKNERPSPRLDEMAAGFQGEVLALNEMLEAFGARLMPTAMHPWMDPSRETCLWPHDNAEIYRSYDRIFRCSEGHGWGNLQSMHVNLPFGDDAEFARLHAAARLALPILPALAASSPIAEGRAAGMLDYRLEAYRNNAWRVPACAGRVIPEPSSSPAQYQEQVLAPMYREIAPLDPHGELQYEWLNSRGVIPRFDRNALEMRLIDTQECPAADIAVAGATIALVRMIYDSLTPAGAEHPTEALVAILLACIRDADEALVDDARYLALLGFPGTRCRARELWAHLAEASASRNPLPRAAWSGPIGRILEQGTLARRILRATGESPSRERLHGVYRELCDCLQAGRPFEAQAAAA